MAEQGKKPIDALNKEVHHEHWREKFESEPYYREGYTYEDYGPAYEAGVEAVVKDPDLRYEDHESTLAHEWHIFRGDSRLDWKEASPAVRAAWERAKLHHMDS